MQVAQLYDFPANADGTGQCIAIIELGGGFKSRDVQSYFKTTLNMKPPKVVAISVDGGLNKPTGDPSGDDGEVMLDIEVGALSSLVYSQVAPVNGTFHDITNGNNGTFSAAPGWDACTGWGSPIGSVIASALTGKAAAGKP